MKKKLPPQNKSFRGHFKNHRGRLKYLNSNRGNFNSFNGHSNQTNLPDIRFGGRGSFRGQKRPTPYYSNGYNRGSQRGQKIDGNTSRLDRGRLHQ